MSQDPAPGVYGLVTQDGFSFAFCNPLLKQSLLYSQDQPVLLIIGLLSESEVAQSCPTLCDPIDTRLLRPWDFLGESTGVGCHFLLQRIFLTQGMNWGLLHCRQTLY